MTLNKDCSKLCIGVRKKTLIYSILGNTFTLSNYIPSKETPMCMGWVDNALFVGCKIAYYLQDVEQGAITKTVLTKASKSWTSLLAVTASPTGEAFLLDSDNTIFQMNKQGIPTVAVWFVSPSDVVGRPHPTDDPTASADRALPLPLHHRIELSLRVQHPLTSAHPAHPPAGPFPAGAAGGLLVALLDAQSLPSLAALGAGPDRPPPRPAQAALPAGAPGRQRPQSRPGLREDTSRPLRPRALRSGTLRRCHGAVPDGGNARGGGADAVPGTAFLFGHVCGEKSA